MDTSKLKERINRIVEGQLDQVERMTQMASSSMDAFDLSGNDGGVKDQKGNTVVSFKVNDKQLKVIQILMDTGRFGSRAEVISYLVNMAIDNLSGANEIFEENIKVKKDLQDKLNDLIMGLTPGAFDEK